MSNRSRSRGGSRSPAGFLASAAAAGLLAAYLTGHHPGGLGGGTRASLTSRQGHSATAPVTKAVAYAKAQLGKPYVWGGCGPTDGCAAYGEGPSDGFDCSGLVMMAYRSAGVTVARTSELQWTSERHVPADQVQDGDLVFFPGVDGTWSSPGHVGLVTDAKHHIMIDAYDRSVPVAYATYGPSATLGGLNQVVGFTQPWGSA